MTNRSGSHSELAAKLKRLIRREILIYDSYLEVLVRQRETVSSFKLDKFEQNNERLLRYSKDLEKAHNERQNLLATVPEAQGKRLSEFVSEYFAGRERSELEKTVSELREKVEHSHRESQEFQMISNFALNLVNGSISLLWQATQNVTRCYSPKGDVKESFSPSKSRDQMTLKKV